MLVVCVMSSPRWLLEFKDFVIYKIQQRNSPEEEEENEEELLEQEEEGLSYFDRESECGCMNATHT